MSANGSSLRARRSSARMFGLVEVSGKRLIPPGLRYIAALCLQAALANSVGICSACDTGTEWLDEPDPAAKVSWTAGPGAASVTARPLSRRALVATLKKNALSGFAQNAFEDEMVARRLFGHQQIVLNRPAAIRHILIDNTDNYTRNAASIRLLYPIVGRGLFLAEGEDWKEQRRTAAPAFAPRTIPLLARHIAAAADGFVADLASHAEAEVDILALMQGLALDIAARSMFSLELAITSASRSSKSRGASGMVCALRTRTLDKVRTEMSLQVLAYNLKRKIRIYGVGPLMAALRT
jgi:hypothetical protein